jgi:hypothetical protein
MSGTRGHWPKSATPRGGKHAPARVLGRSGGRDEQA